MSSNSQTNASPLVWVIDGKTQHPALLLETNVAAKTSLVQWTANDVTEWVQSHNVLSELPSRRRPSIIPVVEKPLSNESETTPAARKKPKTDNGAFFATPVAQTEKLKDASKGARPDKSVVSKKKPERPDSKRAPVKDASSQSTPAADKPKASSKRARPVSTNQLERTDHRAHKHRSTRLPSTPVLADQSCDDSDDDDRPLIEFATKKEVARDDDDDDVEVLFTVRPPSPVSRATGQETKTARAASPLSRTSSALDNEQGKTITDSPAKVKTDHSPQEGKFHSTYWPSIITIDDTVPSPRSCAQRALHVPTAANLPSEQNDTSAHFLATIPDRNTVAISEECLDQSAREISSDDMTELTSEPTQYTLLTSAYLQNLSEICFTILQDRRWRTNDVQMQPLFQWEQGDDLSVVTALSRLYIPRPQPPRWKCTCLLCRDDEATFNSTEQWIAVPSSLSADPSSEGHVHTKQMVHHAITSHEIHDAAVAIASSSDSDELDEPVANPPADSPESRSMYLYSRLFYRKGPWFRLDDVYNKYYSTTKTSFPATEPTQGSSYSPEKSSIRNFFGPASNEIAKSATTTDKTTSSSIDTALLQAHLEVHLPRMLTDIDALLASGMIRFFDDEVECGKTVGLEILTTHERTAVLTKLGAGKKRPKATGGAKSVENEIWKQMSQQQLSFAASTSNERRVLPVRRHVDEIVLERLAKVIVHASKRSSTLSPQTMYALSQSTLASIKKLIKDRETTSPARYEGMCFRLREAPTQALQRCVRLYLCATSGPGNMRGDGTNGWRSTRSINAKKALMGNVVPPPGQHTFCQIQYPGLSLRFGLSSACFLAAYTPLPVLDDLHSSPTRFFEQVFSSRRDFLRWEAGVELRANVDYLVVRKEVISHMVNCHNTVSAPLNTLLLFRQELNEVQRSELRRHALGKAPRHKSSGLGGMVDFMSLLTYSGREAVLAILVEADEERTSISTCVETDLTKVLLSLETDTEKVLGTIGILALHVLRNQDVRAGDTGSRQNAGRPWLRHLALHSCLAYILFDIIPILERRAMYELSVRALRVLLFSGVKSRVTDGIDSNHAECHQEVEWSSLGSCLLSRRARGKALDRLIVDMGHIHRQQCATLDKSSRTTAAKMFNVHVADFCKRAIESAAYSSSCSFSTLRMMARRLKRPLADSLGSVICMESIELGLRFGSGSSEAADSTTKRDTYSDWTPTTDTAVANTIENETNGPGARCSYVGFDDDMDFSSLNVEEFAMELYKAGRLPSAVAPTLTKGGWVGYHNEGATLRAIFRILCSASVLGMDFGCVSQRLSDQERLEHATVHLSPYQQAPFDLHVGCGFESAGPGENSHSNVLAQGFYTRHSATINRFLRLLEAMTDQHVSDLVYDSVASRVKYAHTSKVSDPFLERDVRQVRTLSAVAAGMGGELLSAAFRCLLFDYRHYSGGLPDLHLFRALYECEGSPLNGQHVDLGLWIGESFSIESQQAVAARRTTTLLSDCDDEFLGCTKVGESSGQSNTPTRAGLVSNSKKNAQTPTIESLPARLRLVHDDCKVKVECMMVEVKSSNDRLDPRQEDWLNILDRHGNARVCKFEESKKPSKKRATKAANGEP